MKGDLTRKLTKNASLEKENKERVHAEVQGREGGFLWTRSAKCLAPPPAGQGFQVGYHTQ
jgi:hypothetical protein